MKKAKITIETERLLVISRSRRQVERWCAACQNDVEFVGVEEAAALVGVSQRRVFHLAETDLIHFQETTQGRALFCVNSLLKLGP
jgi:hypothetical protein